MRIHFIAIGGSAMHNLAIALKNNNNVVSGSDDEIFEPSLSRLKDANLLPSEFGWFPERIDHSIDAIILGMHARTDNPELKKAQDLGLKIYSYPEYLFYHSKNKKRIVIGGSHGKTTITAIIMHVLKALNFDFDYLVGSKIKNFDVMVRLSDEAPLMIFEGDEYLSSPIDRRPKFHWYMPDIALISGIAWDHINVFPTFQNYVEQFEKFISLVDKNGSLIYCLNDDLLSKVVSESEIKNKIAYSYPDYRIENGINIITANGRNFSMSIFGKHNMLNISGAKSVCNQLGINDDDFFKAIGSFEGTANRLELLGYNNHCRLYKDFAHAPSKVKATVDSVKDQFPDKSLVACLELHTYSSLNKKFLNEYKGALDSADYPCVYYNKHTLEMKKLPDINEDDVRLAFDHNKLLVTTNPDSLVDWLKSRKSDDAIFLMMSSGNFNGINLTELKDYLIK